MYRNIDRGGEEGEREVCGFILSKAEKKRGEIRGASLKRKLPGEGKGRQGG